MPFRHPLAQLGMSCLAVPGETAVTSPTPCPAIHCQAFAAADDAI